MNGKKMINFTWTETKASEFKRYCRENSLTQSEAIRRALDLLMEGRTF